MKKTKKALLAAIACSAALAAALGLAACKGSKSKGHQHDYSSVWSSNSEMHYHACTGNDCNSVKDSARHNFGEWNVVTPATVETNGQDKRECTVCKYAEYRDTDKLTPPAPGHSHNWGEGWTVADANKPGETTEGKATRTCSATGDCGASLSDKEYTLPVLTSSDYSKSADTATCTDTGSVTYTYNKNGVSVSFDIETPVKADAHNYGDYTSRDETGHYKICRNNPDHKTATEQHDFEGAGGACSKCGYEWQNMLTAANRSVTVRVGGDSPAAKVYGYPLAPAYYTYTYTGEKPIIVSYRYYILGDKEETKGTVTLSRGGQRSFSAYLETKATCTMVITSEEATAFEATLTLTRIGSEDPNKETAFKLDEPARVETNFYGRKYAFTAAADAKTNWYVLTCDSVEACVMLPSENGEDEPVNLPYAFRLDAGEKKTFLMCSGETDATYNAKISKLKVAECESIFKTHNYVQGEVVSATCTESGYTVYACDRCGKTKKDNYTTQLAPHSVAEWDTTAPTCTEDGSREGECTVCQETIYETIPATGHNTTDAEWQTVKAATCTAEGSEKLCCTVCDSIVDTRTTDIDPDAHSYGNYINNDAEGHYKVCAHNAAHKKDVGVHDMAGTNGKCSVCGYVWPSMIIPTTKTSVTVNVGGGKSATVYGYAPSAAYYTYTYKGETAITVSYSYGSGANATTGTVELSRDGRRSFTAQLGAKGVCTMTVTSAAATAFDAEIKLTYNGSANPNAEKTFTLNTSTQIKTTYDGVKYSFTAEEANWYILTCGDNARVFVLGESGTKQAVTLPYQFELGAGETAAFMMCSVGDNATYSAKVTKLTADTCEHNYLQGAVVPATCIESGYTVYTCEKCGDVEHRDIVEELAPHSVAEWDTTAPTCTEDGSREGECTVCQETIYETIPATGHNTTGAEWQTVKAATCTEEGLEKLCCTVCDSIVDTRTTDIDPDAHSYGNYINNDAEGHYKVCAHNAAHKKDVGVHDMAGTNGKCSVCGYVWPNMIIPATKTSVTVNVGGGKSATVYGYAPSAAYYTYTYKGETAITVSYSYGSGVNATTGTVELSRDGRRSFTAQLGAKGVCTMTVTSAAATAFDAEIKLTYNGSANPNAEKTFTLDTSATVNTTYDGMKYSFTAEETNWYVLTCGDNARVFVLGESGTKQAVTLPYAFELAAGEKAAFMMCSLGDNATYSAEISTLSPAQCESIFGTHNYSLQKVTGPTCTAQGYTTHTCERCGHSYNDTPTAKLGHDYVWTIISDSSCTQVGRKNGACSRCDDKLYDVEIEMKSHDVEGAEWQTVKAANCTEEGEEKLCCTVCHNVVDTRATDVIPNAHSYIVTVTKKPTITEEGEAQLICNHNDEHKGAFVALPELTSNEYAKSENGQFITYVITTDIGEVTFSIELEEIKSIGKAIEYAVNTSGMIVESSIDFVLNAVQGGGSGDITYEFGDNYIHATDGYMNTERWITLKEDGTFFALVEKEDRYDKRHLMNDPDACMDDFKGYAFRLIFAQQEWNMPKVYGAAQYVGVLYQFASTNSNSKNFTQSIETKNGKTYYKFSYGFIDPDPNDNTDMNHTISVEFTLNGDYFMDYCKITGESRRGKSLGSGELLATQTMTVTQRSRRGVGEQPPTNPYNEDTIAVTGYRLRYVASVDDALENIVLADGYFPVDNETNTLAGVYYGKTYRLQVVEYTPAEGVNFRYDIINFYLRKHGESGLGILLDGNYKDGDEGHVLASFDPISRLVSLGFYVAGEYDLILKTVKTEKVVSFSIPVQNPNKIDAYVYSENDATGTAKWLSDKSEFEIVTGYSIIFYGRVPHPGYQYSEYTVTVTKDGTAVDGVLSATEKDGINAYVFTPDATGNYTITLTTTHGNCTKTLNVSVLNAPDPDYLSGRFANDFKEISADFNNSQSRFTLTVGETTGVYSYTLNGTALATTLVSGTYSEFSMYFNSASELVFEKDGEKAILFKDGEANAIIGTWTVPVEFKVNVTGEYTFSFNQYISISGKYTESIIGCRIDKGEEFAITEPTTFVLKSGQIISFNTLEGGIRVTVSNYVPITDITLSATEKTVSIGDAFSLLATINPSNATYTMKSWTSDDESVATVSVSGYVMAVGEGTATITVTVNDNGVERIATCEVTVNRVDVTGVTVSGTAHTMYMNGTLTLSATVLPENATNKDVTWSSSNEAVATVDEDGVVTPVGVGTTTITATADGVDSTGWSVTVANVPVESVVLDASSIELNINGMYTLNATITPANGSFVSKEWKSDNVNVATVTSDGKVSSDGKVTATVTAVGAGETTVTFKMVTDNQTFEMTCTVKVIHVPVTGVELSVNSKELNVGESFTLSATVLPENATNKDVTWSSSNEAVATVDYNGNVTAVGKGTANITCSVDGTSVSKSCSVTVKMLSLGVGEHDFSYATSTSHTFTIDGVVGRSYKLTVNYATSSSRPYIYNKFYVDGVAKLASYGASCEVTIDNEDTKFTIEKSSAGTTETAFKLVISEVEVAEGEDLTLTVVDWSGVTVQLSGCIVGREYKLTVLKDGAKCDLAQISIPELGMYYGYYGEITFTYADGVSVHISYVGTGNLNNAIVTLEETGGNEGVEHTGEHVLDYEIKDANKHTVTCTVDGCDYETTEEYHEYDNAEDTTCNLCGYTRVIGVHHTDAHELHYESKNANKHTVSCTVEGCDYVVTEGDHEYDDAEDATCNICGYTRNIGGRKYEVAAPSGWSVNKVNIDELNEGEEVTIVVNGCDVGSTYRVYWCNPSTYVNYETIDIIMENPNNDAEADKSYLLFFTYDGTNNTFVVKSNSGDLSGVVITVEPW